jgi:hypothetical protein
MTIQPKFQINDLVQHKYQKSAVAQYNLLDKNGAKFFEVLYIHTETCSAGTQVFYRLRPFFPVPDNAFKQEDSKIIDISFGMHHDTAHGTVYFREDELRPMAEDDKKFYGI